MKSITLTLGTIALAMATLGNAQAAPAHAAQPAAAAVRAHAAPAMTHHTAHRLAAGAARLHDRVVTSRAAQQRHWIASELHQHRIDATQAASLREAVAAVVRDQQALDAQGREDLTQALALSHRQDILDWAIRSGRVDFEPQRIAALDAVA